MTRWAMVGTGFMLQLIAPDFALTENVQLQVLVSRFAERAAQAAMKHGVPESSGHLDEVLERDDIDVVYVATPHSEHAPIARAALTAGKHVVVEKPMTTSAADTRALCALAAERGLFLMEAMWTAFAPAIVDLRHRVRDGAIGDVQHVAASFCIALPQDSGGRLWDPDLGGGSTLDQGVYPLSFAQMVLGPPSTVIAMGTMRGGVDVEAVAVLDYASGARAVCTSSMRAHGHTGALVAGSKGSIEVPGPFWGPDRVLLRGGPNVPGIEVEEVLHAREGAGYVPMLRAVGEAVQSGRPQHDLWTHDESVAVAATMDAVLAQLPSAAAAQATHATAAAVSSRTRRA